jgi:hypothetical protein
VKVMPERSSRDSQRAADRLAESARREADRPEMADSPPPSLVRDLTWFNVQADSVLPDWDADAGWQTVTKCHRAARGGEDLNEVDTDIEVFNQLYSRRPKIDTDTHLNVGCVRDAAGVWIAVEYDWSIHYEDKER